MNMYRYECELKMDGSVDITEMPGLARTLTTD